MKPIDGDRVNEWSGQRPRALAPLPRLLVAAIAVIMSTPRGLQGAKYLGLAIFAGSLLFVGIVPSACSGLHEPLPSVASDCADCEDTHAPSAIDQSASLVPLREKLGVHLLALSASYADGGAIAARAYAKSKGFDLPRERVSVQVLAASEPDVQPLEQRIAEVGGTVRSVFESTIFATLPVSAIGALATTKMVWRMDMQRNVLAPPDVVDLKSQSRARDAK